MRRDRERLIDILEPLDWIAKSLEGKSEADFVADEMLCYAVAQKLTVIGEAVARLSPDLTAAQLYGALAGHSGAAKHSRPRILRDPLAAGVANSR